MFEFIKGNVAVKKVEYVALEINGLAYKIFISLNTYDQIVNSEEKLYIYTYVKEEAFKLFGFYDEDEREFFRILVNSNGVGPKLAMAILSTYNVSELKTIIANEDIKRLTKVPGVGLKKGQKLILDVKDKIKLHPISQLESKEETKFLQIEEDVLLALKSLGYNEKDISKIVTKDEIRNYKNIEEAIKSILRKFNK